jgi:hypothetical protein
MKAKKERYIDSYESIVLAARNEQSLHGPNSFEYAQFSSKIASAEAAFISLMHRLTSAVNEISHELALIERNYIPIRLLSNQSNQTNLICPKNNSFLGWIPHLDSYQLIQNVKPPPKEDRLTEIILFLLDPPTRIIVRLSQPMRLRGTSSIHVMIM